MTHESFGKGLILAIGLLLLGVVAVVWSQGAIISSITCNHSTSSMARLVLVPFTGTVWVSATNQYLLVTTTGTYILNFTNGVPLPANGQRITVYGGFFGAPTGTCNGQLEFCLVGTITVMTWQPA